MPLFPLLLILCSLQKELNGMIVQEKIVQSKHQKKEIAEVCVLIQIFVPLRRRNSINLRISLLHSRF